MTCYVLESLGCDYDKEYCEAGYHRAEEFYLGEGWYIDGRMENAASRSSNIIPGCSISICRLYRWPRAGTAARNEIMARLQGFPPGLSGLFRGQRRVPDVGAVLVL